MTINEVGEMTQPPRPMPVGVMAARAEAVSAPPVESGARELAYTITVIFEMR